MKSVIRASLAAAAVCALTISLTSTGLGVASAEPSAWQASSAEGSVAPPVNWVQLGVSDRIDILGSDQFNDVELPTPVGVLPGMLTGEIGSVVNVVDGRVDVVDGRGTYLGTIPVPLGPGTQRFAVDLAPAQVADGAVKLSFVLRENNPSVNSCSQPPSLSLRGLTTSFTGQAPDPRTVADFLPGYLDQVLVRVGPNPTEAQQQAALTLVAELTRHYRPIPVRIDVDTSADASHVGSASRRVIELREGEPAALTVENPGTPHAVLAITGTGDELISQVGLFADRRFQLAQSASVTVASAAADKPQVTTIKTFAQLDMAGQTTVLGSTTMYAGFDLSEFAVGPVQEANVHLIAHYTPVTGGEASVLVRSGGTVLATRTLDASGVLDLTGTIPAEDIRSRPGLALELRYVPSQECAPLNNRITFSLDPQSTVAVTPGTFNRGGFPVLPMAFTPDFEVAVDSVEHLRYAAAAVNLMAQQTGVTLQPRLSTIDAAAGSGSGVLIVADGQALADAQLRPPVLPGQPNTVNVDGAPATDVDLNGPVGVVQAFTQNGRTVLAVSGVDDWSLVERTFDYIRAQPARWDSLNGDVVATGAAGATVNLTVREGGGLVNEYPGDGWKWWAVLSVSLTAAAILGAGVLLVVRRRRQVR